MGLISSTVDRLLHTTTVHGRLAPGSAAAAVHRSTPVVDLVVGTALFRRSLLTPTRVGHVDLARLQAGGVNVVGLTIATRFPDLRGTLSRHHFRSLGAPRSVMERSMDLAEWLIARIHAWCDDSRGRLRLLRSTDDLADCLTADGPIGVFIGVQGGHLLDGRPANLARLNQLGVRMFAPAHVMDNEFVGSATGRRGGGLSGAGRELLAEIEQQSMIVDLAHMSEAGIEQALGLVRQAPVLSHTGLRSRAGGASRWRRYSPATRNVSDWVVREVASAGGIVGIVLASRLLGGEGVARAAASVARAVELAGPAGVAIGSDMDGGLRMVVDAAGLPLLTDCLLGGGMADDTVAAILGRNALRPLRAALAGANPDAPSRPT